MFESLEQKLVTIEHPEAKVRACLEYVELLKEEARRRLAAKDAEIERLRGICRRSYEKLPVLPGVPMAWVDFDVEPHVTALVDEYEILLRQERALRASDVGSKVAASDSSHACDCRNSLCDKGGPCLTRTGDLLDVNETKQSVDTRAGEDPGSGGQERPAST